MDFLRKRFNLLSIVMLTAEGTGIALLFWLFFSQRQPDLAATLTVGAIPGLGIFVLGKVWGFLWNMNPGVLWRLLVVTASLLGFLMALILDLHSRFVARRFYTGAAPVPYGILFKPGDSLTCSP